jgi:hypothetical protein
MNAPEGAGLTSASPLRCAQIARAAGYRPAGTAPSAPTFLVVEAPLPWPRDVTEHPMLRTLAPIAAAHQARVQAVVPDPSVGATSDGTTRVVLHRRPEGPFRRFVREERLVPTPQLAPEVEALLARPAPEGPGEYEAATEPTDVLVCTHGSRDVCCGGDGFRVHRDLTALALPGVQVWRTSHTGGHRFAPTALTFPDGRAWASVDAATLAAIVSRSLSPAEAVAHDRGCGAFADPFAQAADGAVLEAEGWRWLDRPRSLATVVQAEDRRQVTVTASGGDGEVVAYRADVVVRRVVPVPECGRPLEEARKSSQDLEVVSLTRL